MELRNGIYSAIAGLLDYPRADFRQRLARCQELFDGATERPTVFPMTRATFGSDQSCADFPAQAFAYLADFDAAMRDRKLDELEELYTRTFDFSPASALEIGWHLFGEDYHRGALLVRLRDELARHGIQESCELPDHLIHVLPLVDRMSPDEAKKFSQACVLPAVEKMVTSLEKKNNPYESLLRCLALMLCNGFGRQACTTVDLPILEGAASPQSPEFY